MNRKLLFVALMLFVGLAGYAQNRKIGGNVLDNQDHSAPHKHSGGRSCGTMEVHDRMMREDAEYARNQASIEKFTQEYIKANPTAKTGTIITIPVVFHVVYRLAGENIPDSRLLEQLDVLNQDYAKTNSDTNLVPAVFKPLHVDTEVRFCLAQRDPNNNTTTGITRTLTTTTTFSTNNLVKATSSGGKDPWNTANYLNLWVCNLGSSLLGYAQFPGGSAATDGVVLHYKYTGKTGATAPFNKGRTATHEVGHYLNLRHIWGDASCGNDFVADTPTQQQENYNCPTFPQVTCSNGPNGDMFMNYMDYVDDACMFMFTSGQKARMQAALSGPRASLATSMGCVPVVSAPPVANFSGTPTTVVVGGSVNFTDLTTGVPTSWAWNFTGGSPSTSTVQNPTNIVYNTVGMYTVSLDATNGMGTDNETKVAYINVVNATCDTLNYPLTGTPALYNVASPGWGYVSGNNSYTDQSKANIYTGFSTSLTQVSGVIFAFGRGYTNGTTRKVNVRLWNNTGTAGAPGTTPLVSKDLLISTIQSNVLASQTTTVTFGSPVTVGSTFYAGFSFDMSGTAYANATDTVALVSNTSGDTNPGIAWEQWNDNTWYPYNDANSWGATFNVANAIFPIICPAPTNISSAPVNNSQSLTVFPNPNNGLFNIVYQVNNSKNFNVQVLNTLGQEVFSESLTNYSGLYNRSIDLAKYSKGIYMVRVTDGNSFAIRKVVVE